MQKIKWLAFGYVEWLHAIPGLYPKCPKAQSLNLIREYPFDLLKMYLTFSGFFSQQVSSLLNILASFVFTY